MTQENEAQPINADETQPANQLAVQSANKDTPVKPKRKSRKTKKEDKPRQRADPTFKRLSEQEVIASQLKDRSNEFKIQETSSPDLFIEIPEGVIIKGTLFDFCRQYSIIEFKSYNDRPNRIKMHNQMARVHWWAKQHPKVEPENILNVVVSAAYPESFLESCKSWGVTFEATRAGIYEGRSLFQYITIVVCEELPLERKYAPWLLFAPPNKEKWRKALLMMAEEGLSNLLAEAQKLRPKEYREMTELQERLARFSPKEREEYLQALKEVMQDNMAQLRPEQRLEVLSKLPSEERLKGLPPEERLKGLPPEERLSGLTPQEIIQAIPTEKVADVLSPEEQQLLRKLQEKLGQNQSKPANDPK